MALVYVVATSRTGVVAALIGFESHDDDTEVCGAVSDSGRECELVMGHESRHISLWDGDLPGVLVMWPAP